MQTQAELDCEEQAKRICELEDDLQRKRDEAVFEQDIEPSLSFSDFTKMKRGTITDIQPSEDNSQVTFTIQLHEGGEEEITLDNPDDYTHQSTLVRLIEWAGYGHGEVGELLNADVTLVKTLKGEDEFYLPLGLDRWNRISFRIDNGLRRVGFSLWREFAKSPQNEVVFISFILYLIGILISLIMSIPLTELGVVPEVIPGVVMMIGMFTVGPPFSILLMSALFSTCHMFREYRRKCVEESPNIT